MTPEDHTSAPGSASRYRPLDWRPLASVGHFVDLEAPDALAAGLWRVVDQRAPGRSALRHPVEPRPHFVWRRNPLGRPIALLPVVLFIESQKRTSSRA